MQESYNEMQSDKKKKKKKKMQILTEQLWWLGFSGHSFSIIKCCGVSDRPRRGWKGLPSLFYFILIYKWKQVEYEFVFNILSHLASLNSYQEI